MYLKIVKVGNYTPSVNSKIKGTLKVPFYCVDKKRQHVTIEVVGTEPRFWAEEDPRVKDMKITKQIPASEVGNYGLQGYKTVDVVGDDYIVEKDFNKIMTNILRVEDGGFMTFGTDKKCYTIFVNYPFEVPPIRDVFHEMGIRTNAADVPYTYAVRVFYGLLTPFIEVPDDMPTIHINQIKSFTPEE